MEWQNMNSHQNIQVKLIELAQMPKKTLDENLNSIISLIQNSHSDEINLSQKLNSPTTNLFIINKLTNECLYTRPGLNLYCLMLAKAQVSDIDTFTKSYLRPPYKSNMINSKAMSFLLHFNMRVFNKLSILEDANDIFKKYFVSNIDFSHLEKLYNTLFDQINYFSASIKNILPNVLLTEITFRLVYNQINSLLNQVDSSIKIDPNILLKFSKKMASSILDNWRDKKLDLSVDQLNDEVIYEKKSYEIVSKLAVRQFINNQPLKEFENLNKKNILESGHERISHALNELKKQKIVPSFLSQAQRYLLINSIAKTDIAQGNVEIAIRQTMKK